MNNQIQLHPHDNVAILTDSKSEIPRGHKIALRNIKVDESIIKFGHVIGQASQNICEGDHVHLHNMRPLEESLNFTNQSLKMPASHEVFTDLPDTFLGYLRSDGSVGTRNYLVVASSVNCSASVVKAICHQLKHMTQKNLDGIIPITHSSGCGQEIGGEGYSLLNRTLAGWVFHPNVVGALVVGLGCEGTTFESIVRTKIKNNLTREIPLEYLNIQESGGTAQTIRQGIISIQKILSQLPYFERVRLPISKLKLALNCGGSDSFSAITANPVLGLVSDYLVLKKGAIALGEIPECYGAESLLYARCTNDHLRIKLKTIFDWWFEYLKKNNTSLNKNLSPGNMSGGITTIIEKSLGSVAKAGLSEISSVVDYAEQISDEGFTLMNTPGFDPVSVTGLVAGGCNFVAFTTGRGSVYGCSIAPTLKISSNSEIFMRLNGDMDFNVGGVLHNKTVIQSARELICLIVEVASGKKTCSENLGIGWEEFVPWTLGEVL